MEHSIMIKNDVMPSEKHLQKSRQKFLKRMEKQHNEKVRQYIQTELDFGLIS
jgi:hypothetical protein